MVKKKSRKQIYIDIGRICKCKKKKMAGQMTEIEKEITSEYD